MRFSIPFMWRHGPWRWSCRDLDAEMGLGPLSRLRERVGGEGRLDA